MSNLSPRYQCIACDPPWKFRRQPASVKPPYSLLALDQIKQFPIPEIAEASCHLYLWVPNGLIGDGLTVMAAWGFQYKTMLTWAKYGLGVGHYFRNATEQILFGTKGRLPMLRKNGRTWFLGDRREHSRKPDEFYRLVESMSPGPRIDVFSRETRPGWDQLGDQCDFFNTSQGDPNDCKPIIKTDGSGPLVGYSIDDVIRLD